MSLMSVVKAVGMLVLPIRLTDKHRRSSTAASRARTRSLKASCASSGAQTSVSSPPGATGQARSPDGSSRPEWPDRLA